MAGLYCDGGCHARRDGVDCDPRLWPRDQLVSYGIKNRGNE
jgi:hypothetical protein